MAVTAGAMLFSANRATPIAPDGWKRLRPGGMANFALVSGTALSWLPIALWLGDESPYNRQLKMVCLYLALLSVWGGMTLCIGWFYYVRKIEWNDDGFRVGVPVWGQTNYHFQDITSITKSIDGSELKLRTKIGSVVHLSAYYRGFRGFMRALKRHNTHLLER